MGRKRFFKRRNLFLISFLAIAGIFSATAIVKDRQVEDAPVAEKADAAVTNGKYRVNVLTNSSNWLQDSVQTVWNPAGSNVAMSRNTNFTAASNSNYATVTVNSTSYSWTTYEFSARTGLTKNENYWFGRGTASSNYNWFNSGINMYTQFRSNDWDNTIIISGTWDNFIATCYGWYNVIELHYGTNNASVAYRFVNKGTRPECPSTPTGYSFSGWYEDSSLTNEWTTAESDALVCDRVLYAKYTPAKYNIVYDRNLNDGGATVTQEKNYGTAVNVYTPGTGALSAARWNPSTFKRFKYWNTTYDDKGTRYNSGASYSANEGTTLYYIEDWYDYRYKVNSGSWVTLVHNDDGKGEGIKAQFAPSTAQELPLNGILSFQYSTNGGSTWNDLSTDSISFDEGGNYNTSTGIQLATVDTIFLKITDSNTYSCWVPGISDRTIAVFTSSTATTGGTPYSMRGNGDNETVTTTEVTIEKGQFVRRGYDGNYTYGSYFAGGTGTAATCFKQVGSDTCVECLITGVYTVYNQKGSYDNWKDVYFTRNEEASAKFLAQQFNTIVGDVCTSIVSGSKSLSDLQNVWGSKSGTTLYKHFYGQITETLAYFKTTSSTTDTDILACVSTYDYIENKYGTTALPNFIGRNKSYPTSAAINNFSPFEMVVNEEDNLPTIIIILASSVSLFSITALSVLMVKKRKRNEQ